MSSNRPRLLITANSSWNIVNFRAGLVRALAAAGYEPVVVAPSEPHSSTRMIELGANFVPISLNRAGLNPLADIRLMMKYRSIVRRLRPAAILAFTIKPNIYGCIAARLQSTPAIPNISGLGTVFGEGGPLKRLVVRMYRLALRRSPVVFFQNDEDLRLFVSKGIIRPGQARRLPGSGVDLQHFAAAPLPPGSPKFLLVARLLSDKGIREYVEAARHIRALRPDVCFRLLGPIDN